MNLYASSTAQWDAAGVRLAVDSEFPEGDATRIAITARWPRRFTLALRRPSWAGDGFGVVVNGTPVAIATPAGSYVEIERTWRTGDAVSIVLPKTLRAEPVPDNPHRVAVLWGPLVLAGDLGASAEERPESGAGALQASLVTYDEPVARWVTPVAGTPGTFQTKDAAGKMIELVPFYRLHRHTYAAYWDLVTPSEYEAKVRALSEEAARLRSLERVTVAFVPAGDVEKEKPFNLQGEGQGVLEADGRTGRRASKWFSVDVPVDPAESNALVLTYNSDTRRDRTLEILVNGQRVGEQSIPKSSVSRFFDVEYAIPAELTRAATRVTVRLQGAGGSEVAPVFGIRTIRTPVP